MTRRKRIALMVAGLAIAAYALLAFTVYRALLAAGVSEGEKLGTGSLYALVAGIVFALLVAGVWAALDRSLLRPLDRLAREVRTLVHSKHTERPLEIPPHHLLGDLPDSLGGLVTALQAARQDVQRASEAATAQVAEQKTWLEVILLHLSEGVVVCSVGHRILLYNQAAVHMFSAPEAVGLGRSLFELVTRQPVLHTLELLQHRRRQATAQASADLSAAFVCATADSRVMLQGRMALIVDAAGDVTGYVLTFVDISNEVAVLAKSDAVRRAVTRELRAPIANLRAASETVGAFPEMAPAERQAFDEVIRKESQTLSDRLEALAAEYRGHAVARWPMADIYSLDLFNCVARHLSEQRGIALTVVGMPLWLHGDSPALMQMLDHLIGRVREHAGIAAFDIEALLGDRRVYVDILWHGAAIPSKVLDAWQDMPLEGALGAATARDILDRHGSEPWSQMRREGTALLRIPLLAPLRPQFQEAEEKLPPRPEFYDFGLMHEHSFTGALGDRRLRDLTFVVFDTETTGLRPSAGDEIISIAGVRVVKGRVLTGETFQRLVHPGRPIPAESVRFHGITDDAVRDKPPLQVVLPQFKQFVGDAVMVAHNAAFDLKFLKLKEAECGVSFPNPVIDTMLLSVLIDPEADHSLDGLGQRLGVGITDRHTALGDSLATAEVLVRMFDLLEAKGTYTLAEVMRASNMTAEMRLQETHF